MANELAGKERKRKIFFFIYDMKSDLERTKTKNVKVIFLTQHNIYLQIV